MLWEPPGGYFLLDYHLQRLQRSASYFGFVVDIDAVRRQLAEYAQGLPPEPRKVRLDLTARGDISLRNEPVKPSTPVIAALASKPVDSSDHFLRHKTTLGRSVFDRILAMHPDAQDVVLWNERRELTETCRGNIVTLIDGRKLTPPVSCGLQPGVFRAYLLDRGEIQEEVVPLDALMGNVELFLINSVRRWCKLSLLPANHPTRDSATGHEHAAPVVLPE
jgi:para-aminobenzoate synthetase/4-amino-4-deoxychorismate lyase